MSGAMLILAAPESESHISESGIPERLALNARNGLLLMR